MAKKYWLGQGVLSAEGGKDKIQTDEEIPAKILKEMGDERVKSFEEKGLIANAPKSAAYILAARNTQKALKLSQKEKAGVVKNLEAAGKEIEKLEAENEKLKAENKGFKGLEKNLKSKNALLEKLGDAYEKLKKEYAELQKQLKEQSKNG
jgi:predicted transcriptional regulator